MRGDKEGPFRGVPNSGRVWRKVPESDVRSVDTGVCAKGDEMTTQGYRFTGDMIQGAVPQVT